MQLDQITANIRMRNPWEAMDLGFALIRHSWRAIYLPWFIFLSILSALCFLIVPSDYKEFALILVWWLKPLYDRFLLNILSHKLFNENLSTTEALESIPSLVKNTGLLSGLTFRRPSFSRGFNLPIWQLERLTGKDRSERQSTLLGSAHSHVIGLTIGMIFIELTIYFSLYAFIILLLPETFQSTAVGLFFSDDLGEDVSTWLHILDHVIYTVAVFIIEPFFVAASFTLYINRRTQLEAWDIELVFRQIAQRLKNRTNDIAKSSRLLTLTALSTTLPLIIFTALSLGSPSPVYAEEAPTNISSDTPPEEYLAEQRLLSNDSTKVIAEIMQRRELNNEKITHSWEKIKKEKKKKNDSSDWDIAKFFKPLVSFISMLFESVLWVAFAIGLLILFITRKNWLPYLNLKKKETADYEAPEVMFGMDIRPQSLPSNIPEAARKLWNEHKHRDALSLLYRGALAQLVTKNQLALKASQTEGDILKLAKHTLLPTQHGYLKHLTEQWKQIAYAHHLPEDSSITILFDNWDSDFSAQNTNNSTDNTEVSHGEHST
ncbi:MAG: hypothetical protein V3U78_04105 [Thiotrichaceae bacterium]